MSDFNDIGISRELDWPRIKKLLTIGLFASVLHLAGDLIRYHSGIFGYLMFCA